MKVAVCGLGRLGSAFATGLARDGHDVVAWNRTPRRVPGVHAAATAAEAVDGVDVVVVVVFDGTAAESVLLGRTGVVAGAAPGTVVVNATTLAPDESRRLARSVRDAGLRYLEAPVLGSVPAAAKGALHVLTGGEVENARTAEPVLRAWSHTGSRRHVGPVGDASALKLVANLSLGIGVAALHEAVQLGAGLGLAREDVLNVLQQGVFGGLVAVKRDRLDQDAYGRADFTVEALAKDLDLARGASEQPLTTAEAVAHLLRRTAADQGGDRDIAVLGRHPQ